MTSSSSRGVPSSRHTPYIKRLKNFFSNSSNNPNPNQNRRDFTSNTSLINSDNISNQQHINNNNHEIASISSRNYIGTASIANNAPRVRNTKYVQGSLNSSNSLSYGPQSYISDYRQGGGAGVIGAGSITGGAGVGGGSGGTVGGGYYNNSSWRKSLAGSGDSRLSTSNTKYRSSLTNSVPQNKPRYDSWSNYTNPNKLPLNNRSSISRYSKERRRESSGSLMNSTKVNDTYYPNRSLSYPKTVDRYSLKTDYYHDKKRIFSTGSLPPKSSIPNFKKYEYESSNYYKSDFKNETAENYDDLERDETTENTEANFNKPRDDDEEDDEELKNEDDEDDEDEEGEFDDEDEVESDMENDNDNRNELISDPSLIEKSKDEPESTEKPIASQTLVENGKIELEQSNEICYPDGCLYPQNKPDTRFEELMKEFQEKTVHDDTGLKHTLSKPITKFSDFPFWNQNFDQYFAESDVLKNALRHKYRQLSRKKICLWKRYTEMEEVWKEEKNKMDQQLQLLHPSDDEMRREIESSDLKKQRAQSVDQSDISTEEPPFSSRRSRRHGDLVTTEAEFQEVLENLSREQDEDPLVRAERLSASIPDMILDPVERLNFKFLDSNNIVKDKTQWSERIKSDFFDNFSEKEHELFSEGFCLYPKRFGAISRHMGGLRSASDCVIHYYVTKKAVNYKQMLALFKKKSSKKRGRGKPGRSRNVSQSETPASTPINEIANPNFFGIGLNSEEPTPLVATEEFSEEQYTDSGRKKRSAAPEFKESENSLPKKKAKKKKEENVEISDEVPSSDIPPEKEIESQEQGFENQELDKEKEEDSNQLSSSENNDNDGKEKRRTISSYWSITEANLFPELLQKHGTKWTTIADELATKSATMVRNYFQRNFEKNDWNRVAEEADSRLQAKFAAVLKSDDKEVSSPPLSNGAPPIPIGTFQHPALSNKTPVSELSPPNTMKVNINSLLSDSSSRPQPESCEPSHSQIADPPIKAEVPIQKVEPISNYQPARSSIMSLLNSELPVKQEPPRNHSNNLKDLLNSPSISSSSSTSNLNNGKHQLANLLSDDTNA